MDELTSAASALQLRPAPRLTLRNGNVIHTTEDKKKRGFIDSVRRFFSGETENNLRPSVLVQSMREECQEVVPMELDSPNHIPFFVPQHGFALPTIDSSPQFDIDIISYLYSYQMTLPADHFSTGRYLLSPNQRKQTVHFLAELHADSPQPLECFHLAVWMLDHLLASGCLHSTSQVDTAVIACLSIAVKYERQMELSSRLTGDCDKRVLSSMERMVLQAVGFELGRSGVIHILRLISFALLNEQSSAAERAWQAAKALSLLAVTDCELLAGRAPSLLAAAVLRLLLQLLRQPWTAAHSLHCQHDELELQSCTQHLLQVTKQALAAPHKHAILQLEPSTWAFIRGRIRESSPIQL